ncbi:type I pullulanase [Aliikangiella sp. G2MR2-5]|uniref:type I pullulanase n=1 Tax=Aliikangiella sp. G2MR2-5 TaxID=2788943 RepID=UPI0018AC5AA9|nr:type I pullulanase [Aliikangiella sp. G2MR2-5]
MISRYISSGVLLWFGLLISSNASADWFFRGTPNGWGTNELELVAGSTYKTCQLFNTGDANGGPRFKIDHWGDWSDNYPSADYAVDSNASYEITFDSSTKNITTQVVASCEQTGFSHSLPSLFFRGTPNGWGTSEMQLVADHLWEVTIHFDGQSNQRFKFDVYGDWSTNYGDNNNDNILEKTGSDIDTSLVGNYRLRVNDSDFSYSLTSVDGCQNCTASETLGAVYSVDSTTFSIWSPDSANVQLRLDGQIYNLNKVSDFNGYTDVYRVVVQGNYHLKKYHFLINGNEVRDPYGKMVEPNTNNNIVMDMSKTALFENWAPIPTLVNREDAIIYEMSVRDFTIAANSGVTSNKKGKFLGMVESGTQLNGESTGIDHLKELGITHVQIMPAYDFNACSDLSDNTCYSWGYDPRNFNVPEERYSLTPYDYENRIREFKQMVNEFHKAGIRVIMDVVYNHTYSHDVFNPISSQYYTPTDLSGTGNSIDANVPMVGRMIQDSLEYWVKEYNIDGFRFDLIGIFDYDEVERWANHLNVTFPDRQLLIYGEPWNGFASDPRELERVRLGTIGRIAGAHVGVFNPKYREALKGKNDSGSCNSGDCFVFNNNPDLWRVEVGSRGAIRASNDASISIDTWDPMFAMDPEQSINYVSAHDNLSLRDKILQWADNNGIPRDSDYLRRIQMFANGIILTSQGIPFLHGGVELMRDKKEDHNSYQSSDAINQIDWQWKIRNSDILEYYKDVIALRKAHPAFRLSSWQEISDYQVSSQPRYGVVVNRINGRAVGDSWKDILVIYNSANNYNYSLPSGNWKVAMEKSDPGAGNGRIVSGSILAEGTAVTILYQE